MNYKFIRTTMSIAIAFILAIACENKEILSSQPSDEIAVTNAKIWCKQVYASDSKARISSEQYASIKPDWSNSQKTYLENGDGVLIVPELVSSKHKDIQLRRFLLFKLDIDNILLGRIVEIHGEKSFLNKNTLKILKKYRANQIDGFDGAIISYDIKYNYIEGYAFKKGKLEPNTVKVEANSHPTSSKRTVSTTKARIEGACEDIYWCYVWSDGRITNCVFMYNECDDDPTGLDPTPTPGGTPQPAPENVEIIRNKLKRPCFVNTVNKMIDDHFQNKVQDILWKFNKSTTLNFTLLEYSDPTRPDRNAITQGNVISLNTFALANASQEFVAKVIYHEVLHVYLGGSALSDHNTMASKYVTPMAQALVELFPSMSSNDAMALSWAGLKQNTAAWQAVPEAEKASYLGIADRYKNLNNGYNHQYGTNCN